MRLAGAHYLETPTYRRVWRIAWPIILANSTGPLLGLVDTAVIGHIGRAVDLGGIALGALIFSFVYWSFGFLRMGTTGFVAQASGAGDEQEVRAAMGRALLFAMGIGVLLLALQWPITWLVLSLLGATEEVEAITRGYVLIRIWGAPAGLALFVLMGVFIGLGHSGKLLKVQLLLNGFNMALDVAIGGILGWGAAGIALGTAISEWVALGYAGYLTYRLLHPRRQRDDAFWPWPRIFNRESFWRTLTANADIMIRSLLLLFAFAWFVDQGARVGDEVLAANHILVQFTAFSAFFLDGFTFAAESLVGRAAGARHRDLFDYTVRISTVLAAIAAAILGVSLLVLGPYAIAALTDLEEVRDTAGRYLPYAACYVLASFAAFQLDGIFIGTTRTRDMRNAAVVATLVFLAAWWPLAGWLGNDGLWLSFIVFLIARAAALGWHYPALRASI